MKRLLDEANEIEQTAILVQYLERKLAKKKAHLKQLKKRKKRDLVLDNLFNGYSGDQRNRHLFHRESKQYERLLNDLSYRDDDNHIVGHRVCRLTYSARENGGHIEIKYVYLVQYDAKGEGVISVLNLASIGTHYLTPHLQLLMRVRGAQNGGKAPCESEEYTTDVVLVQALTDEQAAQYWKGPFDCVVSKSVDRVADRCGELCGSWTRLGYEMNEPEHMNDEELSREEWLARYAHFSPREGLWYCNRTWAEKGEKS